MISSDMVIKEARDKRGKTRRKYVVKQYPEFGVKPPERGNRQKKRVLRVDHLKTLIDAAKSYDPELTLAIMLGAYAGMREGEIVNMAVGDIDKHSVFGRIKRITIDVGKEKDWTTQRTGASTRGSIKRFRKQDVYNDFLSDVNEAYEAHLLRHKAIEERKGICLTDCNSPLFVDHHGSPMSVSTYQRRLKALFYDYFLPKQKAISRKRGTFDYEYYYFRSYEESYPGAHMFRHWFTMYLITVANLDLIIVSKLRGDKNINSIYDYCNENIDLINDYKEVVEAHQEELINGFTV